MRKKIFVTGAAGYIGSTLIKDLLQSRRICRIVALDNESRGSFEHIARFASKINAGRKLKIVRNDFRKYNYTGELKNTDTFVHLAAAVGERVCEKNKAKARDINIKGLMRLLGILGANGIKRFIFTSSQVVYGRSHPVPFMETYGKEPDNFYAITKSAGEDIVVYAKKIFPDFNYIVLRLASVYGFGLFARWGSLTGKFAKRVSEKKPLPVFEGGKQKADFVHVRDVSNAIKRAIFNGSPGAWNQCYNIASGESLSVKEIARLYSLLAQKKLREKIKIEYPVFHTDPQQLERRLDICKALNRLEWEPAIDFREGIEELLEQCNTGPAKKSI